MRSGFLVFTQTPRCTRGVFLTLPIPMKNCLSSLALGVVLAALSVPVFALGMQPDSAVVLISEDVGEGKMILENTDVAPLLLTTTLRSVTGSSIKNLIATPPVVRVDAGKKQLVRFLLQAGAPNTVEQLGRVAFEGIPQRSAGNTATVSFRQDLPVIIRPKGLKVNEAPWTLLKWTVGDASLSVSNPSPYVVRLSQKIVLKPSGSVDLPQTYILPGESLTLQMPSGSKPRALVISPASSYGFSVDNYEVQL